ncbi:MAG TPA: hypothetical protein VJ862_14575 [Rhodanobacteraceae bacterium]|nr:hypothetical protein [Rhodanobacteraceae bacterium]
MRNLFPVYRNRLVSPGVVLLAVSALLGPCAAKATPYVVELVEFAQPGYTPYIQAYAGGAFDLSGLTLVRDYGPLTGPNIDTVEPIHGIVDTGLASSYFALYTGPSGPASFGNGYGTSSTYGSGDMVDFDASNDGPPTLILPQGYVSGTNITSGASWDYVTFADLGVRPGTYTWTWGTGAEQSFTLETFGHVPEPAALGIFGLGVLLIGGFATLRWRAQLRV